jgi:uncharacterized protein YjbI with pentapeptide repeats
VIEDRIYLGQESRRDGGRIWQRFKGNYFIKNLRVAMPFKRKGKISSRESRKSKMQSHTEKTAHQLYENRLLLQKGGDEKSDWESANKIIRNPVKAALFTCHTPLIKLEKRLWEPLLIWANNQALLGLLGLVGNVGIIVAVVTYIGSEKQRRNAEVLNAWQTITSAYGQSGSGGRIQALEFLNASPGANWRRKFPWVCAPHSLCVWPAESLAGINLAVESTKITPSTEATLPTDNNKREERLSGVYLAGIQLPEAYLSSANFEGANLGGANLIDALLMNANFEGADLTVANLKGASLREANFKGAFLREADFEDAALIETNFEGADLRKANLEGAALIDANLEGAALIDANLEGAFLRGANLEGAFLRGANLEDAAFDKASLEGADLRKANLKGAALIDANLEGADLREANLEGTRLVFANLEGAKNLETEQITRAKLCLTKLPLAISLPPNRDCAEIGIY